MIKMTSANKRNRGIYIFHWLLVVCQALKSFQSQIPFLIRKSTDLVITAHISLQVEQ